MIGLRGDDFDGMTPAEYMATADAWRREREREYARQLSAIRLHAAICVQPHCRKTIRPADLFDIPDPDADVMQTEAGSTPMSREQRRERFEKLKKERGYE